MKEKTYKNITKREIRTHTKRNWKGRFKEEEKVEKEVISYSILCGKFKCKVRWILNALFPQKI